MTAISMRSSRRDALAVDVSIARTEGRLPTAKQARAQWAQYQQVVRELGDRELALISAIDHELPIEADVFIALLRARVEFRRACGMLCEPGEQLPGPLEVLALDGRGEPNRDIAVAATAAYTLLCNDAREAARTRVDCFIEYCKEKPLAEQARRLLSTTRSRPGMSAPSSAFAFRCCINRLSLRKR